MKNIILDISESYNKKTKCFDKYLNTEDGYKFKITIKDNKKLFIKYEGESISLEQFILDYIK